VIQTVLPALFQAAKPSTVTVTGGTHNPLAPPFEFLHETFLPAIATAGYKADCKLTRYGFYPAGGGKVIFNIHPYNPGGQGIIDLCEPDKKLRIYAQIYTSRLPESIAQKQRSLLLKSNLNFEKIEQNNLKDSDGPGNCIIIRLNGSRTTVLTAFGMRGKPSQQVVNEAVNLAKNFLAGGGAVDCFLADQLLIYMALLKSGSFTTGELTSHLQTNIDVIQKFLQVRFSTERQGSFYRISCRTA
jgi:RNA 3'-terminal phosphate cyclase (ATP)